MSFDRIANRYAKALMKRVGKEHAQAENIYNQMQVIKELYSYPQFSKILLNPIVQSDLKLKILTHVLEQVKSDKLAFEFIGVIVQSGRIDHLCNIIDALGELVLIAKGQTQCVVKTVVKLSDNAKTEIVDKLKNFLGKEVLLREKIDPKILGGVVVQMGNTVLDLSVKSELDKLSLAMSV